jgi:3-phosphoshikimate 1-carboxyvinyltransferase
MPLPALIEIAPLTNPVQALITVPGSKSITNRALVLAALADGEVTLRGALWSEDTQVMVDCLQKLGFNVRVDPELSEPCNRAITVEGRAGKVPRAGTPEEPLGLFVGNAGTAARFLAAMVCLGEGVYLLHGTPRMHERPQAALFKALRGLGYRIDSLNDKLPALIYGAGPNAGRTAVSIEESSQFASALILSANAAGWQITELLGEGDASELPYVEMTSKLVEAFPRQGGVFQIEADSSSGSYFQAANWLLQKNGMTPGSVVGVANLPDSKLQIDSAFTRRLQYFDKTERTAGGELVLSRRDDLGDSIMTAIVLAPFGSRTAKFVHLGRLRVQESDRVLALHDELLKCGARVAMVDYGETLTVTPDPELHGAEIETYNDHRIAMCFAILGLKVPGMRIKNPACVKKTFPNFFQKLAAPPPAGLGAIIRDPSTGRELKGEELFAE